MMARRFDDSLAEFELALRLNPNFALAQAYYGLSLSYSGRWQEGDEAARRAIRLSPRDPFSAVYYGIAAYAQFIGRNYEEAIKLAREALRQRGDFVGAHRVLTAAAGMAGQDGAGAAAHCRSCAARSRTCRSPGSRPICRSGTKPSASIISKGFARPGLIRLRPRQALLQHHQYSTGCSVVGCAARAVFARRESPGHDHHREQ